MKQVYFKNSVVSFWRFFFAVVVVSFMYSCSDTEMGETDGLDMSGLKKIVSYEVTIDDAREELEGILSYVDKRFTRNSEIIPRSISSSFTVKTDLNNGCVNTGLNKVSSETKKEGSELFPIHVFNFSDERGFALMSGDARTPSLIALSDKGSIDTLKVIDNPGFAIFVEGLQSSFNSGFDSGFNPGVVDSTHVGGIPTYEYGPWENYYYSRDGYCNVAWGQGAYYNDLCPMVNGERTVTGCVATSVAQLMAANKYPASYKNYQFDWFSMTASDNIYSVSDDAKHQIAVLMSELGKSENLNVSYGVTGSGAQATDIPRTLVNFGYSNGGQLKDYVTKQVSDELKNGHCVLLSGYANKSEYKMGGVVVRTFYTNGHAWLGHGLLERRRNVRVYNGTSSSGYTELASYILCNWGWDGYHNGFYLSNAFNAGANPYNPNSYSSSYKKASEPGVGNNSNYRYLVKAVTGIRK